MDPRHAVVPTPVRGVVAGSPFEEARVEDGRVRLDVTSESREIPAVAEGDAIELRDGDGVCLAGVYPPD